VGAQQGLLDRLQRADSWIQAAQDLDTDRMHEAFIFLYIAFNCMYGRRKYEGDESQIEEDLDAFLAKVLIMHRKNLQQGGAILKEALSNCRQDGAVLIRDRFLVNRYWRGNQPAPALQARLNKEAIGALEAFDDGDYAEFLGVLFRRISVLRNQIMHGPTGAPPWRKPSGCSNCWCPPSFGSCGNTDTNSLGTLSPTPAWAHISLLVDRPEAAVAWSAR
jgi:hypothetical protein